ncbi:MAG: zinc ABC transporter solute-binding protein [Micrococcus sp.]|nr:zinc ABC transporter solute-binding protein [Micrococcus sp.]
MSKTRTATIAAIGALALTGCGDTQETGGADNGTLQAVSSFTILTDIVEEVGGEHVEVYNLVPVGQDPHEYDASPDDSKALADADVFFYNGLNLEGGEHGWAARMADAVEMEADQRIETSEGVEPMYLSEGLTDSVNPHAFLDPNVGMIMAENVANGLSEADPENAEAYQENLDEYLDALTDIDAQYQQEIGDLQDDRKVLVTSERAFQYMADRYDLREGYIWSVDTDDVGTPDQIISTIDFVNQYDPPALFVESNVTPAPMETIAEDTGIDIYATVYSDELAPEGEPGDTYIGFLEENLTRISEGLQQ